MSTILALHQAQGASVSATQINHLLGPAPTWARDRLLVDGSLGFAVRTGPAIQDATEICDRCGDLWLMLDARFDNVPELAAALDLPQDCRPIDLLAAAWHRWQAECATHLIGDFAFVIWDAAQQTLFAARDCMGARLLHYVIRDGVTLIATEAELAAAHPLVSRQVAADALCMWAMGLYDEEETLYTDVRCLPAGHRLVCTPDGHRSGLFRQWSDLRPIYYKDREAYLHHFRELLQRCIRDRCDTSAPVLGSMLSGGMDSTSVSAFAADIARERGLALAPFSFRFATLNDCDESVYSSATAARLGCKIQWVDAESFWLFRNAFQQPGPGVDPFQCWDLMDHHILKRLQAMGGKVLLTGHGGDSIFTGLGLPTILGARVLSGQLGALPQLVQALRALNRPLLAGLADYLLGPLFSGKLKQKLKQWTGRASKLPDWIPPQARPRFLQVITRLHSVPRVFSRADRQFAWQLMVPVSMGIRRVIHYYNRLAAPYGIEVRHPLYDRRLAEFMLAIPQELVRMGGLRKGFLRTAMQGILPEPLLSRAEKPDLASFYHYGISQETAGIRALIAVSPLARMGLIDAAQLEARLDRYLDSEPTEAVAEFWSVLMTDLWLHQHPQKVKRPDHLG